jgi:6-phospho-3-hexuloisomerase
MKGLNERRFSVAEKDDHMQKNVDVILKEIKIVLDKLDDEQVKQLADEIIRAKKIVACGAGRVGMMTRSFAMRLGHFGMPAYTLGDSTVPAIGEGDLLLASSGSGETQTTFDVVTIAKKNKARIALVTGNPDSRIGRLADTIVQIAAPSKVKAVEGFTSVQPMTTLNEQCLLIFYDALILHLMERLNETHETMWARHSNLE